MLRMQSAKATSRISSGESIRSGRRMVQTFFDALRMDVAAAA
jgi:hypothetical protein